MLEWPREQFRVFLDGFCRLYRDLFLFPLPVVAAINGHAVAGGAMIALAADQRVMASGRARISLNEITFGASVFAGFVEMLRFRVGGGTASRVLYHGEMFGAEEAVGLGLVDHVEAPQQVLPAARVLAEKLARNVPAFADVKRLLRGRAGERMEALEDASIEAWLDIWYAEPTRRQLAGIKIR